MEESLLPHSPNTRVQHVLDNLVQLGIINIHGAINIRILVSLGRDDHTIFSDVKALSCFLDEDCTFAERIYCLEAGISRRVACRRCDTTVKFISRKQGYKKYCAPKCAQSDPATLRKRQTTNLSRFGVIAPCLNKDILKKKQDTCLEKYGANSPFESADVQQKVRENTFNKYGVVSTALVPEVLARQIATRQENMGVPFPFKSEKIQEKCNATIQERYGVDRWSQVDIDPNSLVNLRDKDWLTDQHHVQQKTLTQIATELAVSDGTVGNYLRSHELSTYHFVSSMGERQVQDYLIDQLGMNIVANSRSIIPPYELDIYIPEYHLAIDYAGLYWHSDTYKEHNYHLAKLKLCKEKGIRLLTIYEDEWIDSSQIVKSKIAHTLGKSTSNKIFARKCSSGLISTSEFQSMMNINHIQGTGPAGIKIGLAHNGQLVAAMGFIQHADGVFVLNRYATNCTVVGGFTKLLAHFTRSYEWKQIVSFADMRWSDGAMYENNGFVLDKVLPPDYEYVKNNTRYHKFGFRHKQLTGKLENYDPALSEVQNCHNHGYVRIFDCGLLRYVLMNSCN